MSSSSFSSSEEDAVRILRPSLEELADLSALVAREEEVTGIHEEGICKIRLVNELNTTCPWSLFIQFLTFPTF